MSAMNVAAALRQAARELQEVSPTARLDAELLMAEALGVTRSELLLHHAESAVPQAFVSLLARRLQCEPIAYILGRQEFHGLDLRVTPDVLIPRGDSECIVEAALAAWPGKGRVLDCGTGSGALLLAVLAHCQEAQGIGIDRSAAALAVARANAARLGLEPRAQFLRCDWDQQGWAAGLGRFNLILANPPYVERDAELADDVRRFEPAGALFAGEDGLDAYRRLVPCLPALLDESGLAIVEIGAGQAEAVGALAQRSGFRSSLLRDLANRPRGLLMRLGLGKATDPVYASGRPPDG